MTDPVQPATQRRRRALLVGLTVVASLSVSLALDGVVARGVARAQISYSYDLFTMFRLAGYLPLWVVVSMAFVLLDSRHGWRSAWSRGGLLFTSVALSGAVSEALKILIRRERPGDDLSTFVFRPWSDETFSTSGLGWPSGHTAVAFAAAWTLSRLHPRATPVWALIAMACAFSRIVRNDHYLSDLVSAAALAYAVTSTVWPVFVRLPRA